MTTDAVVFDLDNTLCTHAMSDREIHEAVFDRIGVEPPFEPEDVGAVDPATLPDSDSPVEFYEHLFSRVLTEADADPALAPEVAEATVDLLIRDPDVEFAAGAEAALAEARDRFSVGLLTQGTPAVQTAKLRDLGIEDAFDARAFCGSGTDLAGKPDPEPFRAVLADLDVPPGRAVYVGDSLRGDVAGANAVGMRSAWVAHGRRRADGDPEPTWHLETVGDLPDVL